MKINTTVTETRVIELNVETPYYCKEPGNSLNDHFMVGEKKVIKVFHGDNIFSNDPYSAIIIGTVSQWIGAISKAIPITEQEFTSIHNKAKAAIAQGLEEIETNTVLTPEVLV
jgi:hypothetical protein